MIENLQKTFFETSPADAALLISEPQRKYLSGFNSSDGYLLITKNAAYYLLDFRYAEAGRKAAAGKYEVLPLTSAKKDLSALIKREGIKTIALEYGKHLVYVILPFIIAQQITGIIILIIYTI